VSSPVARLEARLGALHPWHERLLLTMAVTSLYLCYFPINRLLAGQEANHPITWVDTALPLIPSWMFVYFAVFFTGFVPVLVVRSRGLFRRVALAYLIVQLCAFSVFLLYPVSMQLRAESTEVVDFVTWGLQLGYFWDTAASCLPSIHVTLASLSALCCWQSSRVWGATGFVLALGVALSAMLVKQHYLADLIAGFALASLVGGLVVTRYREPAGGSGTVPLPTGGPAWLLIPYALAVAALYRLYLLDWRPWEGSGG